MEIEKPDWLAQMEGILETLNEGVIIEDDCGRYIFANERIQEMTGFTREAVLGHGPDTFYQGADLAALRELRDRSVAAGSNRVEFFVPHKSGARIPVVVSSRVLEDLEGREYRIVTLTDISEQKRVEQQLRDANAQLAARQREIDLQLSLAERVQQSLAPHGLRWGRALVETAYQPVHSIGGDFCMVVPDADHSLTLLVCDVSGHGISSALIANRIYTEAISLLEHKAGLGDVLRRLNDFVLQHIRTTGFYFSMAAARLEDGGRQLRYAGAGHPPALYVASGKCRPLMPRSAILGLLEDAVATDPEEIVPLHPGDRLVLYTDGLTEAFNTRGDQFGLHGLEQALLDHGGKPLPDLKRAILDRVAAWHQGALSDDSSLVLVEIT